MKRALTRLIIKLKQLYFQFRLPQANRFVHENVPYFCQWESRELADKILRKELPAKKDPRWQQSGAVSPEEYHSWSWSGCGMACLKMILAHQGQTATLVELGKRCASYGGYTLPLESSPGLYYRPFVQFIAQEYKLDGRITSPLIREEIIAALADHAYVIASVNPAIREPASQVTNKGGHLILLLGYDLESRQFFLHNPSGHTPESQEYATIDFADFDRFFSGKGIVIQPA